MRSTPRSSAWRLLLPPAVAVAAAVTLLLPASPASANGCPGGFAGGTGSAGDPFQIATEAQLRVLLDSRCAGYNYLQTADIAMAAPLASPLGGGLAMTGTYDGGGHAITGLSMNVNNTQVGLFGHIRGTVSRLRVQGSVTALGTAGLLAGRLTNASIDDVSVSGTVSAGGGPAGGVVGAVDVSTPTHGISDITADVTVISTMSGGVAGSVVLGSTGTLMMQSIDVSGSIDATGSYNAGGVAARVLTSGSSAFVMQDVRAAATVASGLKAGGLVASLEPGGTGDTIVRNSVVSGDVTASQEYAGGAVGYLSNSGTGVVRLNGLVTTGAVQAYRRAGGMVGGFSPNGNSASAPELRDSRATGSVTATDEDAGGVVGDSITSWGVLALITNVYATGAVTAPTTPQVTTGGLVGRRFAPTVTGSFWNLDTVGLTAPAGPGTAITTAQMRDISTFDAAGWDIAPGWQLPGVADVWGMCPLVNDGLPFLNIEYGTNPCLPTAPSGLTGSAGVGTATIAFTPADGNAYPILRYEYSVDGGPWAATSPNTTSSPLTVTGLASGVAASIRLRAVTDAGESPASVPVEVTPLRAPDPAGPAPTGKGTPAPASPSQATAVGRAVFRLTSGTAPRRLAAGTRTITTRIAVSQPGTIRQLGRITGGSAAACSATLAVRRAGAYSLRCRLTAAARRTLRTRDLTMSVVTTFRPSGGEAASVTQRVTIPR